MVECTFPIRERGATKREGSGEAKRDPRAVRDEARSFGRSAGTLSAGVGVAGLLTYGFFSLASHNLSSQDYGEIVVLWSIVYVTISVLHRPVEQFISRSVAEHGARGEPIGGTLKVAAMLQATVAAAFAVGALLLRGPLEDDLLSGDTFLYWTYFAAVIAFSASFYARGYLAGSGRFSALAALLVVEAVARALFALALALGIATGQDPLAIGIFAAPCVSLLVLPFALGRRSASDAPPPPRAEPQAGAAALASGGGFAAAVLVIMLCEQAFLNTGPLLLRGLEGAAAAGFIFNVLMVARAPLVVFQGVAISLLPHLTRLRSSGGAERAAQFGVSVGLTLRAVAVFTAFVAVVVALAGPELMQIAFGERFEYDRAGLLIVTAAMGLYLAATTLNQAALAQGEARRAAMAWAACAAAFVAWSLTPALEPARRIEVGFALGALVLFIALLRIYRSPHVREGLRPGSPEEIEARLALADEAG